MTSFTRPEHLAALADNDFDVVVIGAGMTGAGVALDAAQRGLRVALIDSGDFASGTSSKSSKMVHGGLRYLQQKEFRLVYENLRERQRLMKNAPHLVRILPFLIPLFGKDGVISSAVTKGYSAALRLYDLTGGWRIGKRYEQITKEQTLAHLPTLHVDRLVAGFLYYDARGDDARVALTLVQTATLTFGATAANYVRAIGVAHNDAGRVCAVQCRDELSGREFTINTASVVNAAGVWADSIFTMTERRESSRITPAKGVHVTVAHDKLPADVAAVFPVPGDRRSVFVVPFEEAGYTFVGTTDTAYDGDLSDPQVTPEDVEYLLRAINGSTSITVTPEDITGVWAGLRPLLAPEAGGHVSERTADLSRRHKVIRSNDGVVHITGGKWTTYREMAEDTVDALCQELQLRKKCGTRALKLYGAPSTLRAQDSAFHQHLANRYGTLMSEITSLIAESPELANCPIATLPYCDAEFLYAAQFEMSTSLVDLLTRRTRAHLMNAPATLKAAAHIAAVVASAQGWDAAEQAAQVAHYRALVIHEFTSAGLSLKGNS